MDYFVRMSQGRAVRNPDNGQTKVHISFYYLPATDKQHAASMVEALNAGSSQRFGNVFDHTFDIVACVWTGKGRVYLDVTALEQIADEYTSPDRYTAAAE